MKRCILLSAGPAGEYDRVIPQVGSGDFVIACDSGYEAAIKYGLRVDMIVGDFDSYHGAIPQDIEVERSPAEKDDTDTMLGAKIALGRGCRDFLLLGALGGRLDHTIANLQLLSFLRDNGADGMIASNSAKCRALRGGTLTLEREPGYLSVFAWGGVCGGVTLEGVKYPLSDAHLDPGFALGVSNEFAAERARVTVREGTLLVCIVNEK